MEFDPRPDYARAVPRIRQTTNGLSVAGFGTPLHLATSVPTPYITSRTPFVLTRPHWFVLSYGTRDSLPTLASVRHDLDRTVAGFHARVVQHECDHLDGILYPMRIRDMRNFGFHDILFPDQPAGDD